MASGYDERAYYQERDPNQEKIIRYLIKHLLKAKKPLSLHELASQHRWKEKSLVAIIDSAPANFERYEDGTCHYVKLICSLSICDIHCVRNKRCGGRPPQCTGLHVCKFYILSNSCKFGHQCHFGHDLTTPHNDGILKEFLLDDLHVEDIKYLMKQTDSRTASTVPKICKFYNHQAGCRNMNGGKMCPYLHICKYYILDNCQFGKGCKRSHNILEQATISVLNKHGIDTRRTPKEILTEMREAMDQGVGSETSSVDSMSSSFGRMEMSMPGAVYDDKKKNKLDGLGPVTFKTGPQLRQTQGVMTREISLDSNSSQTICLYNLKGRCAYGKSCHNVHCDMPFQWLYQTDSESDWQFVEPRQNIEAEMTYSDVKESDHVLQIGEKNVWVTFKTMTGKDNTGFTGYKILRLSTVSSMEMANQPLATVWVWSWKTQTGEWKVYGDDDSGYQSNIYSSDIEQEYLANPAGMIKFATQGHEYELDFKTMMQHNLLYKTNREVRRRPKFVDAEDVEKNKRQTNQRPKTARKKGQKSSSVAMVPAPGHWDIGEEEDILDHYKLVKLSRRSRDSQREYKEIEALFSETMPSTAAITSISRIQNGDLWTNFINKKTKMEKKKKGATNEKRLFHGTHSQYVEAICRQGFDFRLCGQSVGTAFGKGSYFATTAHYSNCYTYNNDRTLFVVKVLVGEYVQGMSKYVRPPPKRPQEPHSDLYDSCVDDEKAPKIFVIFDNNGQVYPEYVINYKMEY